jgi:hypothetical protein
VLIKKISSEFIDKKVEEKCQALSEEIADLKSELGLEKKILNQ